MSLQGFRIKVFVFKLNQIYICQTTIVEKHLRRYYVRMNSMRKSKSWQIMAHLPETHLPETTLLTDALITKILCADPNISDK